MPEAKAFTLKGNGRLNQLITPCRVCKAFDPKRVGKHLEMTEYNGLWDTGASGTVITKKVVDDLGLKPVSKRKVYHANGESIADVYQINLRLPQGVAFSFVPVSEGILPGFDLLIGMDIISRGDFSITNVNNSTTFSFRIPSLEEIDYVKSSKSSHNSTPLPTTATRKISRNEPCPCGSGKKYKHCCGKNQR